MSDSVVELGVNTSSTSEDVPTANDTGNIGSTSEVVPSAESTMTITLDEGQYAQLCQYMATQMYISLAIFAAVGFIFGTLVVQQVLSRWGVR